MRFFKSILRDAVRDLPALPAERVDLFFDNSQERIDDLKSTKNRSDDANDLLAKKPHKNKPIDADLEKTVTEKDSHTASQSLNQAAGNKSILKANLNRHDVYTNTIAQQQNRTAKKGSTRDANKLVTEGAQNLIPRVKGTALSAQHRDTRGKIVDSETTSIKEDTTSAAVDSKKQDIPLQHKSVLANIQDQPERGGNTHNTNDGYSNGNPKQPNKDLQSRLINKDANHRNRFQPRLQTATQQPLLSIGTINIRVVEKTTQNSTTNAPVKTTTENEKLTQSSGFDSRNYLRRL